jgi:glycosyltransferase involved in cell wall biosynthesis
MATALTHRGIQVTGLAGRHGSLPPEPWTPPGPVRYFDVPMPFLYDTWQRLSRPKVTGFDLVHATSPIMPATDLPLVATVHDLAFLQPGLHTRRGRSVFLRGLAILDERAKAVMCSSLNTADAVMAYGIDANRVVHVPLGVRVTPASADVMRRVVDRHRLPDEFVLFVGTREPRKNLRGLLGAMQHLDWSIPLVLVGPSGWGADDIAGVPNDRFIVTGMLSAEELAAMYELASVVAYPSLEEGFGFPVLEAMAHGTPVVTSLGTSTEEVAGDAAVLVDPRDPRAIAAGIRRALADDGSLVAAGRERAALRSWDATAALVETVYSDVLGAH